MCEAAHAHAHARNFFGNNICKERRASSSNESRIAGMKETRDQRDGNTDTLAIEKDDPLIHSSPYAHIYHTWAIH